MPTLIHANAFEYVEQLHAQNFRCDCIITDPPYNISKKNNFSTMRHRRQGVDFGEWDKNFELYDWIEKFIPFLNPNGSVIIFCSYRFLSFIIEKLEQNDMVVKDVLIWKKNNLMPRNINRRYVQDTEFAIWAIKKNAKWTFNKPHDVPYCRSLFQHPIVSGKERLPHPTQKSLKLMEEIIEIHTNENDIILDPFMGSGTTGIAALNLKRRFLGIEINQDYFQIAKARFDKKTTIL